MLNNRWIVLCDTNGGTLPHEISKIVALTVNPSDNFLLEIKKNIEPDFIQLHGEEGPNRCKDIREKFNIPIIKGIGIENDTRYGQNGHYSLADL